MIFNKYTSILEAMLLRIMTDRLSKQTDAYCVDSLKKLLEREDTSVEYLKFSDHYIFEKLFTMAQDRGTSAALSNAIISRLARSCAFDLDDSNEECIFAGTDEAAIQEAMAPHPTYKKFLKTCNKVRTSTGKELSGSDEMELFSFRFEEYRLTRQIPLHIFVKQIRAEMYDATRAERHYYRLATGIPVLKDNAQYTYNGESARAKCEKVLPPLCVDCPQSVLHQIYGMRYVSLRRYKIEEQREPYAS